MKHGVGLTVGTRTLNDRVECMDPDSRSRPSTLQFSLRTLLAVVTLISIAMPLFIPPRMVGDPAPLRTAVEALGGSVPKLWGDPRRIVQLSGSNVDDDSLAALQTHPRYGFLFNDASELYLDSTLVSDKSIKVINDMWTLRKVSLSGCDITDAGIGALARDLLVLDISNTRVTDECCNTPCWRVLWRLDLSGCNISDVGLLRLAEMGLDFTVVVKGCRVTESGIAAARRVNAGMIVVRD